MNRNNLPKFILVLVVILWSLYEVYPPKSGDLVEHFKNRALPARKDTAYTNILAKIDDLQKQGTNSPFAILMRAADTNSLARYFPFFDVKEDVNPNRAILSRLQHEAAGKVRLGLDLQGGTSFLVKMDTNKLASTNGVMQQQTRVQALDSAIEVLRKRVDKFGVAEPVLQQEGNDGLLIQLPGLSEAEIAEAKIQIQKAAFLEFRLVNDNSAQLIKDGLSEPGYVLMRLPKSDSGKPNEENELLVRKKTEMTGQHITSAFVNRNQFGSPEVDIRFDSIGASQFGEVTRNNVHSRLAIILDGELISAPNINEAIEGGQAQITGRFTDKEALELANALENPLQFPVKVDSESSVSPTLGSDTIRSGIWSAIIGTVGVAAFMVCYYFVAGAIADVALIINIIILMGVMCCFGTTLTLPGIAGVVLTVGMAVDANVLIFERIREESAKGKSIRGALSAGYDRAFGTIFDSHVTTLISSIILVYMGTGPIKGFGVTLTIGVAASLFTALVVTRLIFDFLLAKEMLKQIKMLHIIRATKLDFMKLAKPAFILSWTIIVIGLGYGIFVRGHKMLGPDFAGGDEVTFAFENKEKVEQGKLTAALDQAKINDARVQYQRDAVTGTELLRITAATGSASNVVNVLHTSFPAAKFDAKGVYAAGPTVAANIQVNAIAASLLSLLGILAYVAFRYEFSFAVGAVVAVIHDVLMTIGCYCLTGLFSDGRQFNATMLAAVLTIIGFSINDTIVIFDRIREDLKLGVRGNFRELINQALNQTLSRTIITSGTVFIATTSLYFFGGGAINDFAFTFLIGIITGTYSSIYIASALVLWWHKGVRPRATGSQVVVENAAVARS